MNSLTDAELDYLEHTCIVDKAHLIKMIKENFETYHTIHHRKQRLEVVKGLHQKVMSEKLGRATRVKS